MPGRSPLASSIRITGTAVASAVPLEVDAVIGDAPAGRPNPVSLAVTIRPTVARATLRGTYDLGAGALRGRLQELAREVDTLRCARGVSAELAQRWSWEGTAQKYGDLYRRLVGSAGG